jgi:hypothetical protein
VAILGYRLMRVSAGLFSWLVALEAIRGSLVIKCFSLARSLKLLLEHLAIPGQPILSTTVAPSH